MVEKEEKKEKEEKEEKKEDKKDKVEIQGIIHLFDRDIPGDFILSHALRKIKGIGINLSFIVSQIITSELSIPINTKIGTLTEQQIEIIEKIMTNPGDYGVPSYMFNRRKDFGTGKDIHLIATDLTFASRQDVEREKTLYTWKGFRHIYSKKVRGQRTRTTGRKGLTVGVSRKAIREAQKKKGPEKKE